MDRKQIVLYCKLFLTVIVIANSMAQKGLVKMKNSNTTCFLFQIFKTLKKDFQNMVS